MSRSLLVVGVMSMCGVALLLGAGPEREVDGLPSKPSVEAKVKATLKPSASNRTIVVQAATVSGSSIQNVRIRNSGSAVVDVRSFRVSRQGDSRLELVQGSFDLPAGEVAFIITSAAFDVDSPERFSLYPNIYRAVGGDKSVVSLTKDTFNLVDETGFVLGGGNPEIMTVQGNCCGDTCCVSPSSDDECCGSNPICGNDGEFEQTQIILFCNPPNCGGCGSCSPCFP